MISDSNGFSAKGGDGADFFAIASKRLDYIDQRQRVLAQNIANANTPDYHPRDLSPFEKLLQGGTMTPARTDPAHLGGVFEGASQILEPASARAPDGNSVSVEGELTKVADDETSANMVSNLWKTTMGMYLTALGHGS